MRKSVKVLSLVLVFMLAFSTIASAATTEGIYLGGNVGKYYSLQDYFEMSEQAMAEILSLDLSEIAYVDNNGNIAKANELFDAGSLNSAIRAVEDGDLDESYEKADGTGTIEPSVPSEEELEVVKVSAINATTLSVTFEGQNDPVEITLDTALTHGQSEVTFTYEEVEYTATLDTPWVDQAVVDAEAAAAVEDAITALPAELALTDKDVVVAARTAFDALTEAQKELVPNVDVLVAAEATISDLEAAAAEQAKAEAIDAAIAKIDAIGNPATLTLEDEAKVLEARTAVDAAIELGAEATAFVNLDQLVAAEATIADLKADLDAKDTAIQDAKVALLNLPLNVTLDNKIQVEAARVLVDDALDLGAVESDFTNLWKLEAAEAKIVELEAEAADAEAAKAVEDTIAALPAVEELTLEDAEAVAAARVNYEALNEAQQALVPNVDVLEAAEAKIVELEETSQLTVEAVSAITETVTEGDEYVLPATVLVTVEGEEEAVEMEVEWDAEVDTTEAGEFTFTGTLVLPEGYVNTNEVVVEATITVVSAEDAALEAAETAVVAYEEVDVEAITEYAQVEGIEALEAAAVEAVEAVTDEEAKAELEGRIDDKKADVDEALAVFVDAVDAATNQLDLFDALGAFWTVDVDYLVEYWTLVDNGADISDVHAIQENVVEAVTDTLAEQEVVDAIVAAVEAENQLTLKTALETYADNFERLNFASAHIAEYMDEFDTAYTANPTDLDTIEEIQDLIDDANLTLADAAVTTAVADVDQAKWDTANTLVQALKDDVDPDTDKQDLVDDLTEHQLIIDVVAAKTADLEAAITALEDHTDAANFTAEVYDVLLADYVAAIDEATVAINTVAGLNSVVQDVNAAALEAALDDIFAVTVADTEEADFLAMLNGLVEISDFDMTLVNEDWLADYIDGIETASLATADSDGVTELEDEFTTVNNGKASDAKDALDVEADADTVLQALKDLLLTDIVDANADFYFAEVNFQNAAPQSVDFSAADVADIQADVVNTGNLVADVMNAENGTAMRTALAPFGVENADYVELSSAVKLEVAELILADIALDADANGDYTNADTLVTTLGDVVTEMDGFLVEINHADMDTIAEMLALLNNDDARDYVVFADFEELGVADQMTVAEAVLNAIPEDGFATISAVRDAIANAIAGL